MYHTLNIPLEATVIQVCLQALRGLLTCEKGFAVISTWANTLLHLPSIIKQYHQLVHQEAMYAINIDYDYILHSHIHCFHLCLTQIFTCGLMDCCASV
jgi:hypothetical protein